MNNVFGQPIAVAMVLNSLSHHLRNGKQPLTLSFHGDPGTGKNFISQKILKNIFRRGEDSEYIYLFKGTDFPSELEVNTYRV